MPRFKNRHGQPYAYGREEEHRRKRRTVPERIHLFRDDQKQRAEGTLMQRRQQHTGDHQWNRDTVNPRERSVPPELLKYYWYEFQEQNRGVERHAPRHFEHHRMRVPHHQRMPKAVGAAQVKQQRDDHQHVAEKSREDGGPQNGLVALDVEDM